MNMREISAHLEELYGMGVSAEFISHVSESVLQKVKAWQSRPCDTCYPVVFFDAQRVKICSGTGVKAMAVHLALGIRNDGSRNVLGMWFNENEAASYWASVFIELKNRGIEDILIACIDGLKGFPEAIEAVYPNTQVQLCVVHMVRNSMRFVSWKDYKRVAAQLRTIYQAATEQQALEALEQFDTDWKDKYPVIAEQWRRHWDHLITMFNYPEDIRRVIYTTNAIESVNSVIRKATTRHKMFPNDEAALKVVYLAIDAASKKWTMPIRNWRLALNRFSIEFGDRITKYL